MFLLFGLTERGFFGDNPVGQGTSFDQPSIVPAGYAFSIWGIIYLGLLVFPIYQWFTHKEGHALWKSVHYWFCANVIANGLWLVGASLDWLVITTAIILFMLISLIKINDLLIKIKAEGGDVNYGFERFVFSVYFAWITLASALNITAALVFYQWDGFGIDDTTWSVIILVVAALIAAVVFNKYKELPYAGVVVWAFAALIVKHYGANDTIAYLSIAIVIIYSIWMIATQLTKTNDVRLNTSL